ncbi:hypothetical protein [Ancylobacter terrae]|uniref:hypothetical protein n=1 Tax=Ancylobacter sp. sgz301288 TaxID=3342077 RepID=UPI00385A56AA
MTLQRPHAIELPILDSPLADAAYSPEEVTLLEQVLDEACRRAGEQMPLNDGLRSLLATAVLEGAMLGYRSHDELTAFALRVLPGFRSRERHAGSGAASAR